MARRIGRYFAWDRTAETGAPLGDLNNRFPALFELRRQFWPRYQALAPAPGDQDIEGFLQAVFLQNFALFGQRAAELTGRPVDHLERRTATTETLLTDALLDRYDTLIVISFDSQRGQAVTPAETQAVRGFLARPEAMLFACPHHDIGDTDDLPADAALARQTAEFRHQGDVTLPGQQRTGGFAVSLMAGLGADPQPLRPAPADHPGRRPGPFQLAAPDAQRLLTGVPYLNLHPHLPHFERPVAADRVLEVLTRQVVSAQAPPHPVMPPGAWFDSILQPARTRGPAG